MSRACPWNAWPARRGGRWARRDRDAERVMQAQIDGLLVRQACRRAEPEGLRCERRQRRGEGERALRQRLVRRRQCRAGGKRGDGRNQQEEKGRSPEPLSKRHPGNRGVLHVLRPADWTRAPLSGCPNPPRSLQRSGPRFRRDKGRIAASVFNLNTEEMGTPRIPYLPLAGRSLVPATLGTISP